MPLYLVIINTIGPLILAFITIAEIRDTALDAEIQDEQMPSVID
ncbi:membrane protein [Streptomyces phage Miek]|nr:membrane protein [Streptomyces phage Miek]